MRAPHVAPALTLQPVEDRAEQPLEITEAPHAMMSSPIVVEILFHYAVGEEVDERVRFGVDVVAIEEHFVIVQHLSQPPHQGLDRIHQLRVRAQGIQVDPVGAERSVIRNLRERPRLDRELPVRLPLAVGERARLVEEALHIEADCRDPPLVRREVLKNRGEQEFHRARLGGQARDPGNVEVSGLRAEQEVGIEIHRRTHPACGIESDRNAGRMLTPEVAVHAKRRLYILGGGDPHIRQGHRLHRLLRGLPKHRRRPQSDLRPPRRSRRASRIAFRRQHVVNRGHQVRIRSPVHHHGVDHAAVVAIHPNDRADPERSVVGGPEVELVRRGRQRLGRDDPADGRRHVHPPARARR